jgi:hypothetical protein
VVSLRRGGDSSRFDNADPDERAPRVAIATLEEQTSRGALTEGCIRDVSVASL